MSARRTTIAFLLALLIAAVSADAGVGRRVAPHGGTPPPPPGTIATKTFINNSGSTQAAGQPTKMFGMTFVDGDMCSGAAPIFLDGTTPQPFSASPANARVYWNSGCLRFASFVLVPTFSVAGSGSHNVTIKNGGTWPSASSRTLAEVYAQNIVINAPPGAPSDNNVAAKVSSWLDSAANTNNRNLAQDVWLDGDAGKCWRFFLQMSTTKTGAADAAMQTSDYVCALNDSGGNLGGFRFLGCLRMPEFNAAAAPASRKTFASPDTVTPTNGVNWQINASGGGTTTTPLYFPFVAQAFTASGGNGVTTSANAYYQGAGGPQIIPAYFTGGSLPAAINSNTTYFLSEFQGSTTTFAVFTTGDGASSNGGNQISLGAGSGTVHPVVALYPFGRIWMATKDGEYAFAQGSGSLSAETTLNDQQDQTYTQKSRVIPPYDLTLSGSSPNGLGNGGVIADTTFPFDWNPYTIGTTNTDMSGAGDHDDIGVWMADQVVDFYNQSFLSEKLVRINSFAAGNLAYDFKEASTHHTIDFTNGTYTGLVTRNAVSTDVFKNLCWDGIGTGTGYPNAAGFNQPTTRSAATSMSVLQSFDHKPMYNSGAYLRTGELQHLDMLEDQAQQGILTECAYAYPFTLSLSYSVGGILTAWEGIGAQFRQMGWQAVQQQQAAMLVPYNPTNPTALRYDGTQAGKYFNDVADHSANYPFDQLQAGATVYGAANSYVQANGMWTMVSLDFPDSLCSANPCYQIDGPEWEKAFVYGAQLIAVSRGNTKATSFMKGAIALWWKHIGDTFGYWPLYHYYEQIAPISACSRGHTDTIGLNTTDAQYDVSMTSFWQGTGAVNPGWTNTAPYFVTNTPQNSYTPHVGDAIQAWCGAFGNAFYVKPSVMAPNTPYYMTNIVGGRFDLTTVQSEALVNNTTHRITPADTGSAMSIQIATYGPTAPTTNASAFMNETVGINRSIAAWAKALGADSLAGGFAAVVTDANSRFANTTGVCGGSPCGAGGRYAVGANGGFYQAGGNGYTTVDPRYAVQDHFAP